MINASFEKKALSLHGLDEFSIIDRKQGGNSTVLRLSNYSNTDIALKIYQGDIKRNLRSLSHELTGYETLSRISVNIPNLLNYSSEIPSISYTWIEGKIPQIDKKTSEEISDCILSLKNTYDNEKSILNAIDCVTSKSDIENQINSRITFFTKNKSFPKKLIKNFQLNFEKLKNAAEKNLNLEFDTLTLSDFGHHNMIYDKFGVYYFLDFEFFGKDSTIKLVSDLFCHPQGSLNSSDLRRIISKLKFDETKRNQLIELIPFISLKWALISARRIVNPKTHNFIGLQPGFDNPEDFIAYLSYVSNISRFDELITYNEFKLMT